MEDLLDLFAEFSAAPQTPARAVRFGTCAVSTREIVLVIEDRTGVHAWKLDVDCALRLGDALFRAAAEAQMH